MININMVKLGENEITSAPALHSDVVFAIPIGQEVRGVGLDPRDGLFVILKSGREKIYPIATSKQEKDISSLKMVAVEVENIHDMKSIKERYAESMHHDA
ncbi:MAG: hypothetical protein ACQER5_02335 [Pseudomonadota bacterium]